MCVRERERDRGREGERERERERDVMSNKPYIFRAGRPRRRAGRDDEPGEAAALPGAGLHALPGR